MEKKYYKVGETFEFEGKKLEVVKETDFCTNCYFEESILCDDYACFSQEREDEESVVFKEIEIEQPLINKLANQAYETATKRGQIKDKETHYWVEDIQGELNELKDAEFCTHEMNIDLELSDEDFIKQYESLYKNTIQDELSDIFITTLGTSKVINVDIESWIKAKMKYNSLRRD